MRLAVARSSETRCIDLGTKDLDILLSLGFGGLLLNYTETRLVSERSHFCCTALDPAVAVHP